jgi:hypothetical protein
MAATGSSRGRGSTSRNNGAAPEKARVYTNVHTGQKYVKAEELIKTKKARRQMEQLRKKFGRRM